MYLLQTAIIDGFQVSLKKDFENNYFLEAYHTRSNGNNPIGFSAKTIDGVIKAFHEYISLMPKSMHYAVGD